MPKIYFGHCTLQPLQTFTMSKMILGTTRVTKQVINPKFNYVPLAVHPAPKEQRPNFDQRKPSNDFFTGYFFVQQGKMMNYR